jgi:hypothetical protein
VLPSLLSLLFGSEVAVVIALFDIGLSICRLSFESVSSAGIVPPIVLGGCYLIDRRLRGDSGSTAGGAVRCHCSELLPEEII